MSSSLYSTPYWNDPTFQSGGLQSQLGYMQNQAQNNLNRAQQLVSSGSVDPAFAGSQLAYAQAKQNMMMGFTPANAQGIQWGNGPLAAGGGNLSGAGMPSAGGGGFGGVSNNVQEPASGWGTGNNGAPMSYQGQIGQGNGQNTTGTPDYSSPYAGMPVRQASANGIGLTPDTSFSTPQASLSNTPNPFSGGTPVVGPSGTWQMPNGMALGGNGGPTGNYTAPLNGGGNATYNGGTASGMPSWFGQPVYAMGATTGASGSSSGSGNMGYRQMDPSGVMQGQIDQLMGYNPYANQGFGVSNQNNMFNNEFGTAGGGGGDD